MGTHHARRFYNALFQARSTGHLHLAALGMQDLPKVTFSLGSLTSLSLSDNIIQELPGDICELTSLKTLFLGSNLLSSLPPEMTDLGIHELYMQVCCVRSLSYPRWQPPQGRIGREL